MIKEIKLYHNKIEGNMRQIDALQWEIRDLERLNQYEADDLDTFLINNYVGLNQNETFDDHVSNVDYPYGYYTSINEALQDGNVRVFNLKGEQVK